MRVLVMGGTRYFGKRLVQKLIDNGHQVSVASSGKTKLNFSGPYEHLIIDRSNEDSLRKAFESKTWDIAYDQIGYNAHDSRIAAVTLHEKIHHLIFTSSESVYDEGLMLNESDLTAEIYEENPNNENPYQEGKRLAEKEYTTQLSFSVSSVRIPIVLGPDDYTGRLAWHISKIQKALPMYFPNINSRIGFISSEEACNFLYWLMDKNFAGSVNAGSPDSLSLRELIEMIEVAVGKKALLAQAATKENSSPFGITSDWTMNMARAEKLGFQFSLHKDWLPQLILKSL